MQFFSWKLSSNHIFKGIIPGNASGCCPGQVWPWNLPFWAPLAVAGRSCDGHQPPTHPAQEQTKGRPYPWKFTMHLWLKLLSYSPWGQSLYEGIRELRWVFLARFTHLLSQLAKAFANDDAVELTISSKILKFKKKWGRAVCPILQMDSFL